MIKNVLNIFKEIYDIETLLDNDPKAILARIWFIQNHEEQMRECW